MDIEDKLITLIITISMISIILFTITLIILFRAYQEQRDMIITYENTLIETDYCDDDFNECYRTYQTFKDYIEENKER